MTSDARHVQHDHHHGSLADMLDLDAQVLHGYWSDAMAWLLEAAGERPVRRILDVGAGTGVGTVAVAERFPDAEVVAVDASEDMLHRIRSRMPDTATGRVSTVEMDIDRPWPELGTFDVVWASAVLHELADPDAAFDRMRGALNRGGLLAVVEIDGPPRFLEDHVGDGVEARIHDVLATVRAGDNDYPDWSSSLERAGFVDVEKTLFSIDLTLGGAGPGREYAQTYLRRIQPVVEGRMSDADRRMLEALVADDGPMSVRHRDDLRLRARRTGWTCRRP